MFGASKSGPLTLGYDPNFENVSLLLNNTGTNGAQNKSFLDSSGNNLMITPNGNVTQGSFSPYGDRWSNYFGSSANTDYVYAASSSAFGIGTGNFTIECFVYLESVSGTNQRLFLQGVAGTDNLVLGINNGNSIIVSIQNSTVISYAWNPPLNTWHHLAVVRTGTGANQVALYVNGIVAATGTSAASISENRVYVGGLGWASGYNVKGYLSNLRYSNVARTITAPTTPYTSDANTLLLTCHANRFVDGSSSPKTITVSGTPKVTSFSPFSPANPYSATTDGGSGYFDGTTDWLSVGTASNWAFMSNATAKWTIEGWIYNNTSGSATTLFDTCASTTANVGVTVQKNSSELLNVQITYGSAGNTIVNGTSSIGLKANAWNHVFISYDQSLASGNLVFYVNGAAAGTASKGAGTPSSSNPANALMLGCYGNGSGQFFPGYMGQVRISNVVRTPPSSVPTTPYDADANTSLLLNFTNAGIFDATRINDLETVGDAKVSTAVTLFGKSSIAFDGTGDWLLAANSPAQALTFGTGDFTVEAWVNINGTTGQQVIVANRSAASSSTDSLFRIVSGKVYFGTTNTDIIIGSTTLSTGVWYHVAVSRQSGTVRLFLNGNQNATAVSGNTTNFSDVSPIGIGFAPYTSAYAFNGYMSNLRITKGIARYTANFPVPTAPFPVN